MSLRDHRGTGSLGRAARPRGWVHRQTLRMADALGSASFTTLTIAIVVVNLLQCMILLGTPLTSIRRTMNITENWGALERVALWQQFLDPVIPTYTLPIGFVTWSFRAAMTAAFALQFAVLAHIFSGKDNPSFWRWMIGPIIAHGIMVVLMVPTNSDVFFYEAIGDLAANGVNPYMHELMDFPNHPLVPFNFWIDIGTVYGPHWVNYSRAVMEIVSPDPVTATLVHKSLSALCVVFLAWLIYTFARKLSAGNQRVAVAVAMLVAWQPNMFMEGSGQVHNDPQTVILATLGLMAVVLGGLSAVRAGVVLVAMSVMIKFITLPLLGIVCIVRIVNRHKPDGVPWMVRTWVLDGIAIVAVFVGAFLPYWQGPDTLHEMLQEPDRLYTHPIWRTINGIVRSVFGSDVSWEWSQLTRGFLQVATMALFLGIFAWLAVRLWTSKDVSAEPGEDAYTDDGLPWWTRSTLYAWMFMFFTVAFLPVNSHPWYWIWPVAAVAQVLAFDLRRDTGRQLTAIPNWVWLYMWFTAIMTLAYHTRIARY